MNLFKIVLLIQPWVPWVNHPTSSHLDVTRLVFYSSRRVRLTTWGTHVIRRVIPHIRLPLLLISIWITMNLTATNIQANILLLFTYTLTFVFFIFPWLVFTPIPYSISNILHSLHQPTANFLQASSDTISCLFHSTRKASCKFPEPIWLLVWQPLLFNWLRVLLLYLVGVTAVGVPRRQRLWSIPLIPLNLLRLMSVILPFLPPMVTLLHSPPTSRFSTLR